MGLLAKGSNQDENPQVDLQLERLVCPVCGVELPPWVENCPEDGAAVVSRTAVPTAKLPEVPAHLLEGLDDGSEDAGDQS